MNNMIQPPRLKEGAHLRVVAPSRSLGLISEDVQKEAEAKFAEFGYRLSFGKNVNEVDEFHSSAVKSRVSDLHEAFSDNDVDGVLSVIGGYNSHQLLDYIDYELIKSNPKVFCGFSDFTSLANAITTKTGLITYIGPHYSTWGMRHGLEYTIEYFLKATMQSDKYSIKPSPKWSDDPWFMDQESRNFVENEGYWILNGGTAIGRVVGGNASSLNLLQGTQYQPDLQDSILFLEEDAETSIEFFDRSLQSLIHQPSFSGVKAIIIGRFQVESKATRELVEKIVKEKKELANIPIVANADFGHTTPIFTIPVGGTVAVKFEEGNTSIEFLEH